MSKDILKDYFSTKGDIKPNIDFEKRLLEQISNRIYKIECRKRILIIVSIIFGALLALAAICYFVKSGILNSYTAPIKDTISNVGDIGKNIGITIILLVVMIMLYLHITYNAELRRLKHKIVSLQK